jgi:hypothetical protein
MKQICILLSLLVCISCSTMSGQTQKKISFSDIEKLEMGKTTKEQVLHVFGKPNEVLKNSVISEAWIYDGVLSDGSLAQKAAFSFDETTLVGALWIPYESDEFQSAEVVKKHFKDMKFTLKTEGWDKRGHSYSDNIRYYDVKSGISFTVDGYHKTVSSIAIAVPLSNRKVSSQKK